MQSSNEQVNDFLVDIQSTFPDKFETIEEIRKIFAELTLPEDVKTTDSQSTCGSREVNHPLSII